MEKIEVIQEGAVTSCNIGVSKEEWLELLKDSATSKHYKEALIKVFYALSIEVRAFLFVI